MRIHLFKHIIFLEEKKIKWASTQKAQSWKDLDTQFFKKISNKFFAYKIKINSLKTLQIERKSLNEKQMFFGVENSYMVMTTLLNA